MTTTDLAANLPDDRGEFTGSDGKLYHIATGVFDANGVPLDHLGPWLTCDGCNPVRVVQADTRISETQDDTLIALRVQFAIAKAAADDANEHLEAVKAKLKSAVYEASGNATRSELHVPGYVPLALTYGESWRLSMPALKARYPQVYVELAKRSGSWKLEERKVKGNV